MVCSLNTKVVGRSVSHYRILSPLGSGGMGIVFRAEDIRLAREVAIKFLPESFAFDDAALERFRREARTASRINHPNICTVHDIGQDEQGHPFLVMELLEGETLKDRLQSGRIPLVELLDWSSQIADALDSAHDCGIIHRDIKPANLFITTRGAAKILDFGLARTVSPRPLNQQQQTPNTETDAAEFQTSPGQTFGTIAYMSPEQARGEELDRRTDLFSMGVVLYEMATGQPPFTGNTSAVIFEAILNRDPHSVLQRNPALPAELARIITKALEKDRRLRYQSAADLRADVETLKRKSSADHGDRTVARPQRRSLAWFVSACILLLLGAVASSILLRTRQDHRLNPELIPVRVTSNGSEAPVQTIALSPDGKYLAYSDTDGVHVRSIETADSRLLPQTKAMSVQYWAADGTRFFTSTLAGERYTFSAVSLPGGIPHPIGDEMPSPGGHYSIAFSNTDAHVKRITDGKTYSLSGKGASIRSVAWSPREKRVALILSEWFAFSASTIETLETDTGRWTTLVRSPVQINGEAWLSEDQVVFSMNENAPRMDSNLWLVDVNSSTGLPTGPPRRRTQWTDFLVNGLSASDDGRHLCFNKGNIQSNIYVGELGSEGARPVRFRRLSEDQAISYPLDWTPDSRAIIEVSNRDGKYQTYKHIILEDRPELIASAADHITVARVSPDGRWILNLSFDDTQEQHKRRVLRMPLDGGSSQEILTGDRIVGLMCANIAGAMCILNERAGELLIVSVLDPMKGRGAKILEVPVTGDAAISPDGKHIAFVLPGKPQNRIRIASLRGVTEQEITATEAQDLESLNWDVDGTTFFGGDNQSDGAHLLHIYANGTSTLLWKAPTTDQVWGVPSPDGRYLATFGYEVTSNAWIVPIRN